MREMNPSEMKQIDIMLLLEIKAYCERNSITFWLGYGSMLGCVRHKGMIPWDDDIDIIMPRDDYNRFINDYKDNQRFMVASYPETKGYYYAYAQFVDKSTIVEHEKMNDYEGCGVAVDIFPIDGLGNDYKRIVKEQKRISFWRTILLGGQYKDKKTVFASEKNIGKRIVKYCIAYSGGFSVQLNKTFANLSKRYEMENSLYAGFLCGNYREKEIMRSEVFLETIQMSFEGYLMPILKRYDEYLTSLYGDYMKLPPPDKRHPHHSYIAYWKEGKTDESTNP